MKVVGRVSKSSVLTGSAEFTAIAGVGDFVYYLDGNHNKVLCQITSLQQTPYQGFTGYFRILDTPIKPPQIYSQLFLYEEIETGILHIGIDRRNTPVNLKLNPFFRHILIAGKTHMGKTHLAIAVAEELLKHGIPNIIVDTQGEFVNLKNAVVVEDIRTIDLIGYMQKRKTVIINLLGLPYITKAHMIYDILSGLRDKKEEDYKNAEGKMDLLKIPPLLITLDEAEVFACSNYAKVLDADAKELLIDIAKRGSKFGMGLIAIAQRPPFLDIDVRSQCNSAFIFRLDDKGSLNVISQLGYISRYDKKLIRRFNQGECLVTGDLTSKPTIVLTRDITTKRSKVVDFAKILGVQETVAVETVETEHHPRPESTNNLVDAQPFIEQGNLHVPQARTYHHGRSGDLGSTPQQERNIMQALRQRRT